MSITPIGILYIIILLFLLLCKNNFEKIFLFCLTTNLFIEAGYAIKIGTEKYYFFFTITDYFLAGYCLCMILRKHINISKKWLCLALSYIIPVIMLIVFPSNALITPYGVYLDEVLYGSEELVHPSFGIQTVKTSFIFLLYLTIPIYLYSQYGLNDYKKLLRKLSGIIKIFLALGLLEYFIKNVLDLNDMWGNMITFLFGTFDVSFTEGRLRGDSYELILFTRESSHYAYTIFLSSIVLFANNLINKRKNGFSFSLLICFLLLILSTSFSSLLFFIGFISLFLVYRWFIERPTSYRKEIFSTAILIMLLFITLPVILSNMGDGFIGDRLSNLVINWRDFMAFDLTRVVTLGDNSSQARIFSVMHALEAFSSRPLFGLTLGMVTCHGATASFLASVGIIGLYFWIKAYFYSCPLKQLLCPKPNLYLLSIMIYLLVNMLNSLGIRPFYNTTLLLVVFCFCFIFSTNDINCRSINAKDDNIR